MKKLFSILIVISVMMTSVFTTGYASFITDCTDSVDKNEVISGKWENVSELGIIEPGKAEYSVTASVKSHKPVIYTVYANIDNSGNYVLGTIKVIPGRETTKTFKVVNIKNGKHDIFITIKDGTREVFGQKEEVVVMEGYEKQFMDEFEYSGVNFSKSREEKKVKLLENAGFTGLRKDLYWSYAEKSKGAYDWSYIGTWGDDLPETVVSWNAILDYGNGSVYPMWQSHLDSELPKNADVRIAPNTQEGIRAYGKFGIEVLKRFPNITSLEIWNEPNLTGFWTSDPKTKISGVNYEYLDLLKSTGAAIRAEYQDRMLSGLAYALNGNYDEFGKYVDSGIYPYVNNIAYHFYSVGTGIDDARSYENKLDKMESYVINQGGWKPMHLTECGWHTGTAITTRDEEFIAEDLPKLYTICDQKGHTFFAYSFNDAGTNPANKEDNWGMITADASVKKHYVSVATRNKQLNGGLFVGELNLGDEDVRAFVYLKQGKPVVMIWDGSKTRDEHTITFEGEKFTVNDLNGTLVSKGTDSITLTSAPSYINNLSHKYIAMAAKEDVRYDAELYNKTYGELLPEDILKKAENVFADAEANLDNASEASVKESIDEFKGLGLDIIEKFKSGEITDNTASRALYELSKTIETLATVYMSEYDGEILTKPLYSASEFTEKANKLYRNDNSIMQYSDAILTFAENMEVKAQKLCSLKYDPEDVKGYIAGWGLLTKVYCSWFDSFSDSENIIRYGLISQVLPESRSAYVNNNINIKINANNYSKTPFKGALKLYDEENNVIAESENFVLEAGGYKYIEIPFTATRYKDVKDRQLKIAYVDENGSKVMEDKVVIMIKDKISAFVQPSTTTIDKMDSVDLKFTNLSEQSLTFTLNVESDENYKLATESQKVTMQAGEEKIIELPIVEIKETKFHYYTIKYEAVGEDGIVMANGEVPLNFTAIVKSDEAINAKAFNGDISDWYDAYPIYMNSPEKPNDKASWENAEISARAFLKWDEKHLYLLIDAYDDVQYNYFTGTGIWDGDSMQISIDSKNTDSTKYDDDDYELGIAIGGLGVEWYAWQSPVKNTLGNVDFINVIRDDDKKVTRYIAAFPNSEISTLTLKEGNVFGMNIAINEADVLNRDAFYQFTKGTADSKNPSLYADFSFVIGSKANYIEGKATELFPDSIGN